MKPLLSGSAVGAGDEKQSLSISGQASSKFRVW